MGMEDSPEDSSSSAPASTSQLTQAGAQEASAGWPGRLSIASYMGSCLHRFFCSCLRLVSRRKAACLVRSPPLAALHTVQEDSNKEEHGFSPSSRCQRNGARERARSRSPQWGRDVRSWLVDTTDYDHSTGRRRRRRRRRRSSPPSRDHTPRDDAAPGPSNGTSQSAPAPSAAQEQTLPMQKQSRSLRQGYALRSRVSETTDYHRSVRRKGRRRASPPHHDRAPRDDAAAGPSNASSKQAPTPRATREHTQLWLRERSRSPHWGYDLCSRFVDTTECDPSAGRRRVSAPWRCTSGNHSGCRDGDGGRLSTWMREEHGI